MGLFRSKPLWVVVGLLVAGATAGVVTPVRTGVLRQAGHALVWEDPVTKADTVVITVDSDGAGALAAADLVKRGVAPRVAIFSDPPDDVDAEFLRRGLPYEDEAARSTRQLQSLGVREIDRIARVSGTQQEGDVLPRWCDQRGFRTVIVVSDPDHSRRLRRVLDRAMAGHQTSVIVKPTPYSGYDPDAWWHTRGGVRTQIVESQKLLLDYLLHPF